jgi:hypothetical protein
MTKRLLTILSIMTLLLAAESMVFASNGTADLAIEPGRLFFVYKAPSGNSDQFQMLPNTDKNPLILPCDLQQFGGQLDLTYGSNGPTVYPRVSFGFYDARNAPITSGGYSLDAQAMTAKSKQTDGYTRVDSVGIPANAVVRLHMNVELWSDSKHTQAMPDTNPSNNARDIWLKRECGSN